eukprot:jgi/Phyca11/15794/fgenesh1_pg.PHYCAscaffold_15_\
MIVGKRKRATAPFKNGSVAVNKRRYAIADKRQTNTLDDSSDNDSDETFHPNDSNASVASDASTPKTKVLYRQRYPKGPELACDDSDVSSASELQCDDSDVSSAMTAESIAVGALSDVSVASDPTPAGLAVVTALSDVSAVSDPTPVGWSAATAIGKKKRRVRKARFSPHNKKKTPQMTVIELIKHYRGQLRVGITDEDINQLYTHYHGNETVSDAELEKIATEIEVKRSNTQPSKPPYQPMQDYRRMIRLSLLSSLSSEEIGVATGASAGTVQTAKSKVKCLLDMMASASD